MEIEIEYLGNLETKCVHGENGSVVFTDAPKDNQGKGENFSPTDLFAASLGSCVLTIMGIYAKKIGVDITGTKIQVTKEMAKIPPRRIQHLKCVLTSPHFFTSDVAEKLQQAGEHCPVHLSLHPDITCEFIYHWGQK